MRLARVRFEGEIRFPGVARNTTTFDEADGFRIDWDNDKTVRIDATGGTVFVPYSRVMEAVPFAVVPLEDPGPYRITEQPAATAAEPTPAPPARRARRRAPVE